MTQGFDLKCALYSKSFKLNFVFISNKIDCLAIVMIKIYITLTIGQKGKKEKKAVNYIDSLSFSYSRKHLSFYCCSSYCCCH